MMGLRKCTRGGFTAAETTVVVGAMAVLLSLGFMLHRGARELARVSVAQSKLKQISMGMELYFLKYHVYPPQGSDLTVELAPFVENADVFENPLIEEQTPGETINELYREPSLDEIDSPGHYVTAMVGDDGGAVVILETGHRIVCGDDIPSQEGVQLEGIVNLNPRNNDDFQFRLEKPDGSVITRDDLLASNGDLDYTGPATRILFCPKGNGNQNGLSVDGEAYPLQNGTLYTITSANMTVHLYNDRAGRQGRAMGKWWLDISAANATIQGGGG